MILTLCLALAAQQPQISYSCRAKRAPVVVEELAVLTGRKLRAGSKVENDVLVIDVKDVSTDALLERIAWAVNGTWEQSEDGYTLVRTQVQERQEYSDEIRKRTADYAAAIAKDAMELGPELDVKAADELARNAFETNANKDVSKRIEGLIGLSKRSPAGKLLTRLLLAIGPAELAAIPAYERRVYAFKPTNLQRAIPGSASSHLATFAREQALYAQAFPNAPGSGDERAYFYGLGIGDPKPLRGEPQVHVVVSNDADLRLSASLSVYDQEGPSALHSAAHERFQQLPPLPPQDPDPFVDLGDDSRRYLQLIRESRNSVDRAVPTELDRFFYEPELHDPLQLVVSDALIAWARQDRRNLVASPQDSVLSWLSARGANTGNLRLHADFVHLTRRAFEVRRESEWLGIRAGAMYPARGNRTSRAALGNHLRGLRSVECPSFQQVVDLVLDMPYGPNTNLSRFVTYAVPEIGQLALHPRSLLTVWRSLNPTQLAAVQTGTGIPAGQLSRDQQEQLLHHLCYANGSHVFTGDRMEADPTYRYADGRLWDYSARFNLNKAVGVQTASAPAGYGYQVSMDLRTFAQYYLYSRHPERDPQSGALAGAKYRLADVSQFVFRLLLDGNAYLGSSYSYATKKPGSEMFTIQDLPETIKEEVLKLYEEHKKQMGIGGD